LFNQSPYKNVIVSGIVLAEDGQKMSKRLKNYPEITYVLDKYGADAMRYYLMSSPTVRAQDLAFSEKGVDEVVKKLMQRLQNVYTFYAMYASEYSGKGSADENILDRWIIARYNELAFDVTKNLEKYELDRAAKPFMLFVDDLSTWYLRRSRDRFKGDNAEDKQNALYTLNLVLKETAKLLAPFMPFLAEDIYQKLQPQKESVHLESWPAFVSPDTKVIEDMAEVRRIVSLGLEARAKANIKVRQPLASFTVEKELTPEYMEIVKDELNVKEIVFGSALALDTTITPELKLEGQAREFIRAIQDLRKKNAFNPTDTVELTVAANDEGTHVIEIFKKEISKTAQLRSIVFREEGTEHDQKINIEEAEFFVTLTK
jgi:isoleucyl-tRNA synthetase